jgi:iron complex transport system ATP-binding protein
MRLTVRDVGYRVDGHILLEAAGLDAAPGSIVGLVGANGAGKTTLLRLLYRALEPQTGTAWLDHDLLWELPAREVARRLGAVPQDQPGEFDLTVLELVTLGRIPHQRAFERDRAEDRRIVAEALATVELTDLAGRRWNQLSGGERQRAIIARALAQQPAVLLLDEPTNHLDVRHQHEVLGLLRRLRLTTVVAIHDLNLVATYCDQAVVLLDGRVIAAGRVGEVLVPGVVEEAFGVAVSLVDHPATGHRQLLFHPLEAARQPTGLRPR